MNELSQNTLKKKSILYVTCGIIGGFFLFIYPASFFFGSLIILVVYFIYNRIEDQEKSFLLRIFFYSLTLRLMVALVTHILSAYYGLGPRVPPFLDLHGGAIIGDDIGIHQRAWALARLVKELPLSEIHRKYLLLFDDYGWSFHLYFLSFFYYLFGTVPLLGKFLNSLFGVLTGILVYFISKELFNIKTAKLAVILTLFFPTLFLWSIANLKDTILIFLLTFFLYTYILFLREKRLKYLFLLAAFLFLIGEYRTDLVSILILAIVISLVINIKWNYKKILLGAIILAFLLNGYFVCKPCRAYTRLLPEKIYIYSFMQRQKGYVDTGGTCYKIYPDRFYQDGNPKPISLKEIASSLLKGALSLMFRPFPWEIDNMFKLFYYPVAILWDLLSPFFIMGFFVTIRYYFRKNVFLLSAFIIIFVLLSLTQGNVGTMIRHRDMITPLYIIFSSFGFVWLLFDRRLKAA